MYIWKILRNLPGFAWRLSILLSIMGLLLIYSLIAGCGMNMIAVKPIEPVMEDAIRREELSLVLVRVRPDTKGRSFSTYPWPVRLGVARTDTGEPMTFDNVSFSPSEELRKEGWLYGVLPPGKYFLQAGWSVSNVVSPSFRFEVPRRNRFIYIGSLVIDCVQRWNTTEPACSRPHIVDETEEAHAVARSAFARLPTPATLILQPESDVCDPAEIFSKFSSLNIATEAAVNYTTSVEEPPWVKQAMKTWMFLGSNEKDVGEAMKGLMEVPMLNAIPIAWIFTLPATASAGAIAGSIQKKQWEPCFKTLPGQLNQIDLAQMFNEEFAEKLQSKGYVVNTDAQQASFEKPQEGIIEITVLDIVLKPSRPGDACLSPEIMVHARVSDSTNAASTCGRTYIFGVTSCPTPNHYPYAMYGMSTTPCRQIDNICASNGPTILKEDLANTVREAAAFIANDLNRLKKEQDRSSEKKDVE